MEKRDLIEDIRADVARGTLQFPTSAEVGTRIRQLIADPDCPVDKVARLVQAEPLLAARVVAIANSSAYNRSSRPITDVRAGVTRLGYRMIQALATALMTRQMSAMARQPEHRQMATQLWEHTAHVAALAQVCARGVTRQDPEVAMFAGIVHEIGGFYLLSRAGDTPGLLEDALGRWSAESIADEAGPSGQRGAGTLESEVGRAILGALDVPGPVVAGIEALWQGYLSFPPATLGDTMLLADYLAPVRSPLTQPAGKPAADAVEVIDMMVGEELLSELLRQSEADVRSLSEALRA